MFFLGGESLKQPIRIFTPEIDLLSEIDNYQSLQFERNFFGVGQFELHINMYMYGAEYFQKGNIILLDKQANKAGLIRSKEITLDETGKASENYTIKGYTLDGLMNRRITVPPSDTAYDRKSGDAETVMKHYVERHFVNPDDPKRKMPMLEIAPNKNRGGHVEYESRFKIVAEELETIGQLGNLGWNIFIDVVNKKLIFDVIEPKDLTQENEQGNSPVFFSPDFGTVQSQLFTDSDNDYRNYGYVGGQGEGIERKVVEVGEAEGWDRIETFVDARDVGTTGDEEEELTEEEIEQQLIQRGKEKMREMERLLSFEAEILTPVTRTHYDYEHEEFLHPAQPNGYTGKKVQQVTPFNYEEDFDLGDLVDVVNKKWGITMKAPIVIIKEIHETSGFRLEATFGEDRPTVITKIQREFDELNGIEKQELPSRIQVQAIKYTDEKVSEEEKERIQQAQDNLRASVERAKEAEENAKKYTKEQLNDYVTFTVFEQDLEMLRQQADNQIQTHFYDHAPTMDTLPASDWETVEDKERHVGDMFYNRETGYAYTFVRDAYVHEGYNHPAQPVGYYTYAWERIQDKDIIEALEEASTAKDTADSKRRTFLGQPYTPYDPGDLWIDETGSIIKIYTATVDRIESESFNAADWDLAGDITNQNTSHDTEYIAGEQSAVVKSKADSGQSAKDKIDTDVGPGTIEDTIGSQLKADEARDEAKRYTDSNLTNYVEATVYDNDLSDIQAQIDNQIQSHFYDHEPTLDNLPAGEWTDEKEKARHVGDLFFNSETGYSYRFAKKNGEYEWVLVRDEGIAKALEDAADAQDTADSKRRVFIAQPTTPYDAGDLWDNNGTIYRSVVNKTQSASFSVSDWVRIGDVTEENTAKDTKNVDGRPAENIEDKEGAQDKANNAERNAKTHTEQYSEKKRIESNEPPSDTEALWIDTSLTPNVIKYYSQGRWEKLSPTEAMEIGAETPEGAQEKADGAQNAAEGYADVVSESAYLDAVADAEAYLDENGIIQGREYNGVSITNEDGFLAVRADELVRSGLNATDGIFVQNRSSATDEWQDAFFVDENGNLKFSGVLEGAGGTFEGTVKAATITGSEFISEGYSGNARMRIDAASLDVTGVGERRSDGEGGTIDVWYRSVVNSSQISMYNDTFGGFSSLTPEGLYTENLLGEYTYIYGGSIFTDEGTAEIIVDQGSNENGHYIRYASGLQTCWNHIDSVSVSNSTHTEQGITFYRGGPFIDFPKAFIETPAINYDGDLDGGSWRAVMNRAWSVRTDGFGAQFMGLSPFSTVDRLSYIAIGRWK